MLTYKAVSGVAIVVGLFGCISAKADPVFSDEQRDDTPLVKRDYRNYVEVEEPNCGDRKVDRLCEIDPATNKPFGDAEYVHRGAVQASVPPVQGPMHQVSTLLTQSLFELGTFPAIVSMQAVTVLLVCLSSLYIVIDGPS